MIPRALNFNRWRRNATLDNPSRCHSVAADKFTPNNIASVALQFFPMVTGKVAESWVIKHLVCPFIDGGVGLWAGKRRGLSLRKNWVFQNKPQRNKSKCNFLSHG